jgi:hypothetical protein
MAAIDDSAYGKAEAATHEVDLSANLHDAGGGEKYDAAYDRRDMRRLGRIQEVRRRFRFFSIVGYMVILGTAEPLICQRAIADAKTMK